MRPTESLWHFEWGPKSVVIITASDTAIQAGLAVSTCLPARSRVASSCPVPRPWPTPRGERTLAEILDHVAAWNASTPARRARLLRAVVPFEASAFVAHSNALEGVPTLSAADTLGMLQGSAAAAHDPAQLRAARNTYDAFRLARAFRLERAAAAVSPADELLWHVPQVLAVHRAMAGLHPCAGRLRVTDARPADRDALYVPAAAVRAAAWSFFDVANGRVLRLFADATGAGAGGAGDDHGGEDAGEDGGGEDVLDEDDAVREDECVRLLGAPAAGPDVRDIDARALAGVVRHAAWFAAHFLELHPFADGNGRAARILVDALLARVHPVPVALVPAGASLAEARTRYLAALRALPPWARSGAGHAWAADAPALADVILESLAASWRRLASAREGLFGGGAGPFLGVLVLSARAPAAARSARYARLGHAERERAPTVADLAAEAGALPPPPVGAALTAGAPVVVAFAPTGRAEDGWCSVGWVP